MYVFMEVVSEQVNVSAKIQQMGYRRYMLVTGKIN